MRIAKYFVDVMVARYAPNGTTPLAVDLLTFGANGGDLIQAYKMGKEYLEKEGLVEEGWRVNAYGYPGELDEKFDQMTRRCVRNRQAL